MSSAGTGSAVGLGGESGGTPISGRSLPQGGTAWPGMGAGAGVVTGAALGGSTLRLQPLPWWARVTEPPGKPCGQHTPANQGPGGCVRLGG